jgi:hypothetical protein
VCRPLCEALRVRGSKREEAPFGVSIHGSGVFADLEGLEEGDGIGPAGGQLVDEAVGPFGPSGFNHGAQPDFPLVLTCGDIIDAAVIRQPLVDLRSVAMGHFDDGIDFSGHIDDDVGLEGIGFGKGVVHVYHDGVIPESGNGRDDGGNRYEV